jgi:hypothetical protein
MGYDKRISELPTAGSLDGTELFAVVQGGVTKYTQTSNVNYVTSNNYGLYTQTGDSSPISGSASPVATSGSLFDGGVGTLTVPANGFKVGDTFHLKMAGKINISNGHTLDIKFKSDGVTLIDTGNITLSAADNKNWNLDVTFVIRNIGGAGTASILSTGELTVRKDGSGGETVVEIFSSKNTTTFDTTIQNTLISEAILGSACTDAENIYSEMFVLHKIY